MTIREAEIKLKSKSNELEYWINKKNIILNSTIYPNSKTDGERVDGGLRVDRYAHLDYSIDEIDPIINDLNREIHNLEEYIDKELKLIEEYEPLKAKIIILREQHHMKWEDISQATHYSTPHCKRIYSQYINKRYVEDDTTMIHISL